MRLLGSRRRPATAEADVAVVGSGLPALAMALELARRGASVVLAGAAPGAPGSAGLGLVLLGPGQPYSLVARALGRPAAQLVWAAGCENHLRAKAFLEESGRGCGYRARGSFLLAADRAQAEELAESEDMLRDDGFPGEFLDHYMLETRFDLSGFPGAYWAAEDAELDASLLAAAVEAAARNASVSYRPGRVLAVGAAASGMAVELDTGSLRVAAAVVTDGPAARLVPELAPSLRPAGAARLALTLLAGANLPSAVRTADGRIAWRADAQALVLSEIGPASEPRDGHGRLVDLASRLPLDAGSARPFEESGEVATDGLPLVGRLPDRPLAVACGFGGLAAGLAFSAARWVADALLKGTDPTPEPLRATRAARRPAGI